MIQRDERIHWVGAGLAFAITQVVYLFTMTRSCPFWDSGEFIATSYILGIPHPPGTPLFELIGRIFTLLPIFHLVATRVNWLSALSSSLTAMFTYLLTVEIWRRMRPAGALSGPPAASGFSSAQAPAAVGAKSAEAGGEVSESRSVRAGAARNTGSSRAGSGNLYDWMALFSGLTAALFMAFSRTFWDNAIEAEVYSLSSLIMAMSVWLILRWARAGGERQEKNGLFILLYYLLCLSMGIHLGTFLVLPGIILFVLLEDHRTFATATAGAVLVAGLVTLLHPGMLPTLGLRIWVPLFAGVLLAAVFFGRKWTVVSARGILTWCLIVAVIGMSTHFYLTIRALYHNPNINEADPQTWSALWKVLTRDQYKPPNPFLIRKAPWSVQFGRHFWDYARDQFALGLRPRWLGWYLPYLLGIGGAIGNLRRDRKSFAMMALNLLIMTVGLVFYLNFQTNEVRDRDYFFVSAYQFFAVWIGLGVGLLLETLREGLVAGVRAREAVVGIGVLVSCLPLLTCRNYWFTHDRHKFFIARDFAYNMLVPLKPDAILFTNGDNDTFPLWYLQEVEKIRRDVKVANLSLLNTDWYIRQLRDYGPPEPKTPPVLQTRELDMPHPSMEAPRIDFGWSDKQIADLEPYLDPKTQQPVYVKDIATHRIVDREYGKRPIYVAVTVPDFMGLDNRLVMEGLAFELKDPLPGQNDRVDADLTLHNLRDVYKYRGILKPDGTTDNSVYKDENASRLIQNYAAAYLRAAEDKLAVGDEATAMAAIQTATRIAPDSRPIRYSLGILLMRTHRYADAERHFEDLIRQGYSDSRLYRMLGRSQEAQGKYEAAEDSYRKGLAADPDDFDALRDVFSYLWQLPGKQADALDVLREWTMRHPDDQAVAAALSEYTDSLTLMQQKAPGGGHPAGSGTGPAPPEAKAR